MAGDPMVISVDTKPYDKLMKHLIQHLSYLVLYSVQFHIGSSLVPEWGDLNAAASLLINLR